MTSTRTQIEQEMARQQGISWEAAARQFERQVTAAVYRVAGYGVTVETAVREVMK